MKKYIAGPFTTNRHNKRKMLSIMAARNKKTKGASEGYRGRSNNDGVASGWNIN